MLEVPCSQKDITCGGRMIEVVLVVGVLLLKSFSHSGKDLDDVEHLQSLGHET